MSWIDSIFSARKTTGIDPASAESERLLTATVPIAGVPVDEHSAMSYSAVWACVGLIAETIASLSWHTFKADGKKKVYTPGSIDRLLDLEPNPETDAVAFRESELAKVLTWGNGVSEIEMTRRGEPVAMWPIEPQRVHITRDRRKRVVYDVANRGNSNTPLQPERVFHVHGLGFDGLQGYSPIDMARQSISMGLAMEQFGAEFFGNGAHLNAVLERDKDAKPINENAKKKVLEDLAQAHAGQGNSHGVYIPPRGMTYKGIGVPPEAAQFLQSRKFQISDIAGRWYRVPPHMVGELDRSTFSNIEHQAIEFVRYTIRRWARKLEIEADRKLLGGDPSRFTKINLNGLLRGDTRTRGEFYRIMMDRGVYSINDVLGFEDMNPIAGGDRRFIQKNMVLLDAAAETATAPSNAPTPETIASAGMDAVAHGLQLAIGKECLAARRATTKHADDPKAFDAWLDKFYGTHAECVISSIRPACMTLARLADTVDEVDDLVASYAENHVQLSREALRDAYEDDDAITLLDEWVTQRAAEAAVLLTDQITSPAEEATKLGAA